MTVSYIPVVIGKALSISGTGCRVDYPNLSSLIKWTNGFTICGWFNASNTTVNNGCLWNLYKAGAPEKAMRIFNDGGVLSLQFLGTAEPKLTFLIPANDWLFFDLTIDDLGNVRMRANKGVIGNAIDIGESLPTDETDYGFCMAEGFPGTGFSLNRFNVGVLGRHRIYNEAKDTAFLDDIFDSEQGRYILVP